MGIRFFSNSIFAASLAELPQVNAAVFNFDDICLLKASACLQLDVPCHNSVHFDL
jgi:hypothetical protein